jgi:hypothetical protein
VRVFSWNGNAWVQKVADIIGDSPIDYFGSSVSMPDANTLAVGATGVDQSPGRVRVYIWYGSA